MKTFEKGNLSESQFVSELLKCGYNVLIPFGGGSRYDVVIEVNKQFKSIQVKTGKISNGIIHFNTCSNNKGYKRKSYHDEVDFLGIYCPDNNKCYIMPVKMTGQSSSSLRLSPPKSKGRGDFRYAKDFELKRYDSIINRGEFNLDLFQK